MYPKAALWAPRVGYTASGASTLGPSTSIPIRVENRPTRTLTAGLEVLSESATRIYTPALVQVGDSVSFDGQTYKVESIVAVPDLEGVIMQTEAVLA
jgi:hypothetical protein